MILACQLYQHGKLSSGQAAGLVGISKREFIEKMGSYGYSIFSESVEDLRRDIANA
jgi:predicted HTH domain antitoxin